jgi:urea transport system substrate-binding protein
MGVVYHARQVSLERPVALKMILAGDHAGDEDRQRFRAEAVAVARLRHPNIVQIYDVGEADGHAYFGMEYVEGGNLAGKQDWTPETAATMVEKLARAVHHAHTQQVVHRDLKPANVLLTADGEPKVSDFGLAKRLDTSIGNTKTGDILGTPAYMAPEQAAGRGKQVGPAADVWAIGAILYRLLTGRPPFEGETTFETLTAVVTADVVPPRRLNPAVPPALEAVCLRCLEKDPARRFPSAAALADDLSCYRANKPLLYRPSRFASAVGRERRIRRPRTTAALLGLTLVGVTMLLWRPWHAAKDERPGAGAVAPPPLEPVRVGVLHSLSGTMATSTTPVVDATLFAIDEVNQNGGVLGRQIKPVVADGGSDWPTFGREAERLITQEKVCTIFGRWSSAGRKAVKSVVEAHDHVLVYPVQYEGLETSPSIVYLGAVPNQQTITAIEWAVHTLHKKRFFLIGSDYVFPRAVNAIIKDHLKKLGGEVTGEEYIPLGSSATETAMAAIVKTKPDMILNTINGDTNIIFCRDLRAAGVKSETTPTLSFSVSEQGLRSLGPGALAGDYSAYTYFQSIDTAENREFVRRFHDTYPQRAITAPMETAYVGVKLWAAAVNECQSTEPRKICRSLLGQRINGPGGEIRIDPDTQHAYRTPRIAQVQPDGQFKVVWSAPGPVKPEPYPAGRKAEDWKAFLNDLYTGWGNQWAAPAGR